MRVAVRAAKATANRTIIAATGSRFNESSAGMSKSRSAARKKNVIAAANISPRAMVSGIPGPNGEI